MPMVFFYYPIALRVATLLFEFNGGRPAMELVDGHCMLLFSPRKLAGELPEEIGAYNYH